MSKEERLLEYLREHKGITSLEAIYYLGDTRLSATIFNLRAKGYNVQDIWKQEKNRYGKNTRFKFYHLIEGE